MSMNSRIPMESIREEDETVEQQRLSAEIKNDTRPSLATMTVSVRRRGH